MAEGLAKTVVVEMEVLIFALLLVIYRLDWLLLVAVVVAGGKAVDPVEAMEV